MKNFSRILILWIFITCPVVGYGQLKTIQCFPVGRPFDEPVIALGSGQQLLFSFDDLSSQDNSYTYKILHCDPDWKSSNLSSFTYLSGFFTNPIENYEYSYNTQTPYTHFTLRIPNDEVNMKISGNYLLQIFNDNNLDSAVISQPFAVVEDGVAISTALTTATNPKYLYTSQQLNFTVSYDNLAIYNPVKDVRVYVTQNQDPNTRRNFHPTFIRQNQLIYGDGLNNVFNGLSPFRNFQCSSLSYYTQYVKDVIKSPDGIYNFILQPATVPQRYIPQPNLNGNYSIEAENVQNQNLEADYIVAHFAVLCPQPFPDSDVYIYGKLTDWQLLPALKMNYDDKNKAYTGQTQVKQGIYDYMFAVVPKATGKPNLVDLQNNFYQTPNQYYIRFYLYDYNLMCFRFLGYQKVMARF